MSTLERSALYEYSIYILFRLWEKMNSIRVYFKDPDGEILSQYNCLLDKKMLQMSDGEIPDAIMFNIALKLHFQKTGIYTTELFFNASQLGEYKLKVSMR